MGWARINFCLLLKKSIFVFKSNIFLFLFYAYAVHHFLPVFSATILLLRRDVEPLLECILEGGKKGYAFSMRRNWVEQAKRKRIRTFLPFPAILFVFSKNSCEHFVSSLFNLLLYLLMFNRSRWIIYQVNCMVWWSLYIFVWHGIPSSVFFPC